MLQSYLTQRTDLSTLELSKMWKGLFFSMWHCDKPRNQQALAKDFGSLIHVLPKETVIPWLDAFWDCMAREWIGIDALRMDKYLYLIRVYLRESFQHFANQEWKDAKRLKKYMNVLKAIPLNPTSTRIPNGMRYHLIDIYVDELDAVETKEDDTFPVEVLLEPLRRLGTKSDEKIVRNRVKEALKDERLEKWGAREDDGVQEVEEEKENEEFGGFED
jgi:ribosomal RNA-processing protein 1